MQKVINFCKKGTNWVKIVLALLFVLIPYAILYYVLRKQGKTINIIPKIEIVDIKTTEKMDTKLFQDVVKKGQDIIARFKEIDDEE